MQYRKTFYYRLAVSVEGERPLRGVTESATLSEAVKVLGGVRRVEVEGQEVELRPVALDEIPKTQPHSFEGYLERLQRLVERLEISLCPNCRGE
jgi:hypothetical protein